MYTLGGSAHLPLSTLSSTLIDRYMVLTHLIKSGTLPFESFPNLQPCATMECSLYWMNTECNLSSKHGLQYYRPELGDKLKTKLVMQQY